MALRFQCQSPTSVPHKQSCSHRSLTYVDDRHRNNVVQLSRIHYLLRTGSLIGCASEEPPFPFHNVLNDTAALPVGTGSLSSTATQPSNNASMCQVIPLGLGPVDGGPPNPDVYSTACSCSNLFSSHAATIISTFANRVGPVTETLTSFTDTSYEPPDNCCIKCWISARDVQIMYWPVETETPKPKNATYGYNATSTYHATLTATPSTYTLTSDGQT